MDKGHWFWHSTVMNKVEQWLLDLTHWVWAKRHDTPEVEAVPTPHKEDPVIEPKKITTRKPAVKKAPKGNEWSVK